MEAVRPRDYWGATGTLALILVFLLCRQPDSEEGGCFLVARLSLASTGAHGLGSVVSTD